VGVKGKIGYVRELRGNGGDGRGVVGEAEDEGVFGDLGGGTVSGLSSQAMSSWRARRSMGEGITGGWGESLGGSWEEKLEIRNKLLC
jgi:hypothetical protein